MNEIHSGKKRKSRGNKISQNSISILKHKNRSSIFGENYTHRLQFQSKPYQKRNSSSPFPVIMRLPFPLYSRSISTRQPQSSDIETKVKRRAFTFTVTSVDAISNPHSSDAGVDKGKGVIGH
ncbi:uncharacterized protein [Rutidosis leptorrhynchoides]|uniref:uncharacterized protein n=1 Tax=Rutidosis leptorrhynchoides TaxID=125765 RepID=UPI003A99641A